MSDMTPQEAIKANAAMVVEQMRSLSGFDFGYDTESVKWLDGYIERLRSRDETTPELVDRLTSVFGSYLGECVIARYGGEWREKDDSWIVAFNDLNGVFPFGKVAKQFANGPEDSIASFFETIGIVFAAHVQKDEEPAPDPPRKPWWKLR